MKKRKEDGNHTFSLSAKSSYTAIQNIRNNKLCILKWHDKYFLNVTYEIVKFKNIGVEIQLHQSLAHRSWIVLIINPSSLLAGKYCPTTLFHDVKKIPKIHKKLRAILDECGITVKPNDFKLNRVDLTCDEYLDSDDEVDVRLDVFKKSYPIPRYKPVPFGKFFNDDGTYEDANKHSWTIACKDKNKKTHCEFSVYDKGYELAKPLLLGGAVKALKNAKSPPWNPIQDGLSVH